MIRYDAQYRVNGVRFELQTNVGIRGPQGAPGADGRSLEFVWDGTRLGVRVQGESTYQYTELKGADGSPGADGRSLEFVWDGTRLGIRVQGESTYQYTELKGADGSPGADGRSLEFLWSGTRLGVRVQGESTYQYTELRGADGSPGIPGPQGEPGKGFAVLGYYATAGELAAAQISPGAGDAYGVGSAEPYDIYIWDAVNHIWRNNGPLQGARGEPGQPGADGRSLEFVWDGTRLGIRVQGESTYQYTELKGADGAPGADGRSLEFLWSGTRLGIRVQGESTYQYTELKGADGSPGAAGEPGYTPQRGTDYWTAADQAQIVQDVLAALPNASGVSF